MKRIKDFIYAATSSAYVGIVVEEAFMPKGISLLHVSSFGFRHDGNRKVPYYGVFSTFKVNFRLRLQI